MKDKAIHQFTLTPTDEGGAGYKAINGLDCIVWLGDFPVLPGINLYLDTIPSKPSERS